MWIARRIGAQILPIEAIAVRVLIGVFVEVRHFGSRPTAGDHLDHLLAVKARFVHWLPERGSPRPSPSMPWQNWQSALSRNRRSPNDTSWASTAPKPRTIAAVAARGPQVFMSALQKGVDDAATLALISPTRTAWSGCAFRAVR